MAVVGLGREKRCYKTADCERGRLMDLGKWSMIACSKMGLLEFGITTIK